MQQQPRLSKQRILQTALDIADAEGLDALSMRRLAQALDVWPMSVYRYFQDKDALLDAMAAHSAAPATSKPQGDTWQEQLKALLKNTQHQIASSAEIGARIPRAFLEPEPLKLTETAMQILEEAGFSPREAASAWRALYSYTFGFATFRLAPAADEARRRMRMAIAALPEGEYPATAGAADDLATAFGDDETEFDSGIDRLLDGLEASLRSAA